MIGLKQTSSRGNLASCVNCLARTPAAHTHTQDTHTQFYEIFQAGEPNPIFSRFFVTVETPALGESGGSTLLLSASLLWLFSLGVSGGTSDAVGDRSGKAADMLRLLEAGMSLLAPWKAIWILSSCCKCMSSVQIAGCD